MSSASVKCHLMRNNVHKGNESQFCGDFLTSYICTSKGPGEINDHHAIQDTVISSLKWNT